MAKFVPRQRKQKALARERAKENAVTPINADTNVEQIDPEERKRLREKKAQLKQELKGEVKVSGKKAKRLDKYIEKRLRKDENREVLAKLAQQQVDTSLFVSSKSLGQSKETKRQALSRALKEKNAGVGGGQDGDDVLFEERPEAPSEPEEEEHLIERAREEEEKAGDEEVERIDAPRASTKQHTKTGAVKEIQVARPPVSAGSGLKRPLEVDAGGKPVLRKRQRRGGVESKFSIEEPVQGDLEEEWSGFSSSDDEQTDIPTDNGVHTTREGPSDSEIDTSEEDDVEGDEDGDTSGEEGRPSAFKAWANAQRNMALGFKPTEPGQTALLDIPKPENFEPRAVEQEPLPQELQPTTNLTRKAYGVTVTRTPDIQDARMQLPVVAEEQRIMESIHNNDIVVICGATGSGKTTQIPQFLYEAGYGSSDSPTPGMIGVTQPRRVAAVSMSKRVAEELGDHSKRVAYQIRFEGTTSAQTAIKFMTDGVLLREMAQDFSLKKYSAIVIDEAHERSVNTDILIGMLSRINNIRKGGGSEEGSSLRPLKIIIMSATLRVEDMTQNAMLFPNPPPVVEVEGRQHPVTMHFSRRTRSDYVDEAFGKISRGHRRLPPGGFLVFLTSQNEISQLSKQLKAAFGTASTGNGPKVHISASEAPMEVEDIEFGEVDDADVAELDEDELDGDSADEDGKEEDEFVIGEDEKWEGDEEDRGPLKMQVLPLYSLLPTREQMKVFEEPPVGTRQVILATNVAETSLTIPGIRYVFDCGRSKERNYDKVSGVQTYKVGWVSKASANQRSGRAGRTGPGHCYRLYSSAVYERDLPEFSEPELLRMPIDGVVLQLKAMNLANVVNFPFPTPPDRTALRKAEKLLSYLSAISAEGQVTRIGSTMSIFPLSPRFARILLVGHQHDCLHYTIALVAGLSAAEVFIPDNQAVPALAAGLDDESGVRTTAAVIAEDRQASVRRAFNAVHHNFCHLDDRSDAIKLLQVVGEFAHEPTEAWCEKHFVRFKVLREIQQLRRQIVELLRANVPAFKALHFEDQLDRPSDKQVAYLKQMVAAGFIDQVAIRLDKSPMPPGDMRRPRRAIDMPYLPLMPLSVGGSSRGSDQDEAADKYAYLHPSSPLAHLSPQECPEFVVYASLQRSSQGADPTKKPKTRMHALTDVTGGQLAGLARGTPLISYGKPVKEANVTATTREAWVVPYLRAEGVGGQGWPLPMKKVSQRKVPGKGWVTE